MERKLIVQKLRHLAADCHINEETAKTLEEAVTIINCSDVEEANVDYERTAFICDECRAIVNIGDKFCHECRRRLIW